MTGPDEELGPVQAGALMAREWLETRGREDGSVYITAKDGAPQWVTDLCRAGHSAGDMLPDDWRYQFISDAVEILAEDESGGDGWTEAVDANVDVYTHDLLRWVASRNDRGDYVDRAAEEYGPAKDFVAGLMAGQFARAARGARAGGWVPRGPGRG